VVGYGLDERGFESRHGLEIFLFTTASRRSLGSTQPPIQWIPGALSLGVKRPRREADHSLPSSAEVKNAWNFTSTTPVCLHGVVLSYSIGATLPWPLPYFFMEWCLVKHRQLYLYHGVQAVFGIHSAPVPWIPGALSLGIKRPGREANHSSPSSAKAKNAWIYSSTPP
jgi:hypothetical protein